MAAPRIRSIEFISPVGEEASSGDNADVQVKLEDGSSSSFVAATPDQPGRWMDNDREDFSFGTPTLFIARLEREAVAEAVQAMAQDMGGYWLRYFNSLGDLSAAVRELKLSEGSKRRKKGR